LLDDQSEQEDGIIPHEPVVAKTGIIPEDMGRKIE
jgi:hypothetical protein